MAVDPERRAFLRLLSTAGGIALGSQLAAAGDSGGSAPPHSRLIFEGEIPDVVKRVDDGAEAVVEPIPTAETEYDYVAERVWNSQRDAVSGIQYEPLNGSVSIENNATDDAISLVYARDPTGSWQYLFDLSVPSPARTRLTDAIHDDEASGESDHFERSFDDDGIRISWRFDPRTEGTVAITVPYSLYAKRRTEGRNSVLDYLPRRSNNDFDQYVHRALTEALRSEVADIVEESDSSERRYRVAEIVSRFVQTIPHAVDQESKGQLNYIRTPEESLAELTADCKDASLLIYHLLRDFGYDPKLVFLVGENLTGINGGSEPKREKKSGKSSGLGDVFDVDLYPNHLAVVVPKRELEPIPRDVRDHVSPIEHAEETYLYVESTSDYAPGVVPESNREKRPIVY